MLKKAMAILISVSIVFGSTQLVMAANTKEEYYICYNEDGTEIARNMPKETRAGTHSVSKVIKSGKVSNENRGYHPDTNVWRKVSRYSFTTSKTHNISVAAGGYGGTIGISKSTSTGFSYTIEVKQSKYSKLRVYVSYTWKRYQTNIYDNYTGRLLGTYYPVTTQKTHEQFKPVYQ